MCLLRGDGNKNGVRRYDVMILVTTWKRNGDMHAIIRFVFLLVCMRALLMVHAKYKRNEVVLQIDKVVPLVVYPL